MNLSSITNRAAALAYKMNAPADVTLTWTEWPNGHPDEDPTTGATLATEAKPRMTKTCTAKALFHSVSPAQSGVRMFAEIKIGHAILDFISSLKRVTAAGGTDLEVGQVLGERELAEANLEHLDYNPATATDVDLESLEELSFTVDGQRWVQAEIGDDLARSWDAIFGVTKSARSILVRKAT